MKSKFLRFAPWILFLFLYWSCAAAGLTGSGGWGSVVLSYIFFPIGIFYCLVFSVIIHHMFREKSRYFGLPHMISYVSLLVFLFIFGATLVDVGDVPDEAGSALTNILGVSADLAWLDVSRAINTVSLFGICASAAFVLVLGCFVKGVER